MTRLSLLSLFFIVTSTLSHCQFTSKLIQLDSAKYQLQVTWHSDTGDSMVVSKRLPYIVFKLIQADVDNDGKDEFTIGAIKATYLDSTERKRINIWKIENEAIVPLWLGSKMPQPLYDFEIYTIDNKCKLFTIEFESSGLFLIAEYEWHSFGLKFLQYIKREISLNEASTIIKHCNEQ